MAGYIQETVLKTAPLKWPISVNIDVKDHLRLPRAYFDEDNRLKKATKAAYQAVEDYTGRKLITQTWYAYYDDWPDCNYFILPFGNLQSVTSVKYTDVNGDQTTWDSSEYHVEIVSNKGRIVLAYGYVWPSAVLKTSKPIVIEFVCGYGNAPADIPEKIRQAILLKVGELYENREIGIVGQAYTGLPTFENLLADYRLDVIV